MSYDNYSAKGLLIEFSRLSYERSEAITKHSRMKKIVSEKKMTFEIKKISLEPSRKEMAEAEERWNMCRNEVLRRLEYFDQSLNTSSNKESLLKDLVAILTEAYTFNFEGILSAGQLQPIPEDYFDEKIYKEKSLSLKGFFDGEVFNFRSQDGFTRQQVLDAVLLVEESIRNNDWHHVFFEGIHFNNAGIGVIHWGS